jgi:cellulose synthase/poly-beta-1,6-N-acetylglucosamine synthase-like glycosyltransferase
MLIISLWILFTVSLLLIVYNYLIYPLFIVIYAKLKPLQHPQYSNESEYPSICLVIPAISNTKVLKHKIENTLKLYYPKNKLMILAISDKNNEPAQAMLREYKKQGVINFSKRGMPPGYQALNIGAKLAKSDIIVFSDANNEFNDLVLMKLARHFKDPNIAAVSGVRNTIGSRSKQASAGDDLYWKYETLIKKAESKLGSVTAAAGEILAIRRELYSPVSRDYINFDAAITFDLVKRGYRVIIDDEAISLTLVSADIKNLFKERTLKARGSFQTLFREFTYLMPPRDWFSFSFVSHKVLRWIAPFLLLVLFIVPWFMLDNVFMQMLLIVQVVFYLYGAFGWFFRNKIKLPGYTNLITYFTVMNAAMFVGFFRFLIRR